jgi:hypothetical protein
LGFRVLEKQLGEKNGEKSRNLEMGRRRKSRRQTW